ncbi:hypothetical protein SAMN05192574_101827 [Mucilaginibacter gossypiicola]|uniref:Uncharacterized protein n=1 Tax=Mucilaginibacter gossypiicola TaxID=551995 RepID=A0A1H8B8G4_9SPHI|nr:hypothetical protein SAMN05192574_101827 [Mucilaginibacter gossypiicola]
MCDTFSDSISHISETERFNILKSDDRIMSPKLHYFGLSLFLALLVPLNSFTPMLYNGAIDHLFVAASILVLHLILFAMLICGG